jgi:hypothetical protein
MLVYVSHPFSGLEDNKQKVEAIVRDLVASHPEDVFISPIHALGYLYHDVSYETGLEMCMSLLNRCDKMLVFGDYAKSRGCTAEILYCQEFFIPYEIVGDGL